MAPQLRGALFTAERGGRWTRGCAAAAELVSGVAADIVPRCTRLQTMKMERALGWGGNFEGGGVGGRELVGQGRGGEVGGVGQGG